MLNYYTRTTHTALQSLVNTMRESFPGADWTYIYFIEHNYGMIVATVHMNAHRYTDRWQVMIVDIDSDREEVVEALRARFECLVQSAWSDGALRIKVG